MTFRSADFKGAADAAPANDCSKIVRQIALGSPQDFTSFQRQGRTVKTDAYENVGPAPLGTLDTSLNRQPTFGTNNKEPPSNPLEALCYDRRSVMAADDDRHPTRSTFVLGVHSCSASVLSLSDSTAYADGRSTVMTEQTIYEKFEQHAHRTFKEAADRYLDELPLRGKGVERAMQSIQALLPYIGNMRLIDVDDGVLKQFKEDRRLGRPPFVTKKGKPKPAMVGTVNKDLTQVVTILNAACRVWRWIPSAPKILHLMGDARTGYPFTWDEQDRVLSNLPTGWDTGVGLFAINTGARKEEIFGLRWDDLVMVPELGPDIFVLVLNRTKNGKKRPLICNSIARRVIGHFKERMADPELIFAKTLTRCQSGKAWQTSWKLAGLPDDPLYKRGLHNGRHTFAHRLRAAGVPEEDRNFLLGHSNRNLAQHYAIPDLRRLLEAAELITERRESTVIRSTRVTGRRMV
jgi:integrase